MRKLLSDYVGRRMMFLTGMAGLAFFAIPYFMLVSTSNIWLFMFGSLIVQACGCAVRAAVCVLRRAVLHQNALQRLLTGLPVRSDLRRKRPFASALRF